MVPDALRSDNLLGEFSNSIAPAGEPDSAILTHVQSKVNGHSQNPAIRAVPGVPLVELMGVAASTCNTSPGVQPRHGHDNGKNNVNAFSSTFEQFVQREIKLIVTVNVQISDWLQRRRHQIGWSVSLWSTDSNKSCKHIPTTYSSSQFRDINSYSC